VEDLRDRVVVVTGAARGIGAEYCRAFARHGAAVVAGDVRDCRATVASLEGAGDRALAVQLDVGDAASSRRMAEAALSAFGRIDVLINNAAAYGNLGTAPFDELDEDEWDLCMRVNVKGIWLCCRAVVPAMRRQGAGSIVNISSLAARYGLPNGLHYATSKAAVLGLTRSLARELGRHRIRVNAIAPSLVATEGTDEMFKEKRERFTEAVRQQQALRESLEPRDLVGTALFLASDMSRFITGQTIMVDGGTVFL
jgi:3-oxoacyl-[acyl-carrier protein] reductase